MSVSEPCSAPHPVTLAWDSVHYFGPPSRHILWWVVFSDICITCKSLWGWCPSFWGLYHLNFHIPESIILWINVCLWINVYLSQLYILSLHLIYIVVINMFLINKAAIKYRLNISICGRCICWYITICCS